MPPLERGACVRKRSYNTLLAFVSVISCWVSVSSKAVESTHPFFSFWGRMYE